MVGNQHTLSKTKQIKSSVKCKHISTMQTNGRRNSKRSRKGFLWGVGERQSGVVVIFHYNFIKILDILTQIYLLL